MQIKTSSMISGGLNVALNERVIGSKKLATAFSAMDERLFESVSNIKTDEQIEEVKRPKLWFVNTPTADWKTAEKDIFSSLDWNNIRIGEPTEAEFIIEDLISETSVKETVEWVYELFLENSSNTLLLCTLMHALSHMDYEVVYPYGSMMAMAMLNNDDKNVVSFAIKAISNWNSKDSLKYVKNSSPKQEWAKQEWDRVVNYIEENGDELNGVFDEKNHLAKMDTRTA